MSQWSATVLAAGINLVSFSCDKLLGGPQSGIIAGDPELVQRVRRNPMYQGLWRVDKIIIEGASKQHSGTYSLKTGKRFHATV